MKLSQKDLRQLYASGGLAIAMIATGAGAVWWAHQDATGAKNRLVQTEQRASDIRNRLRQVNVEEQEIRAKSALLKQLEERKVIGPERRLDWIELVDSIREQQRLFEIDYEISQQKPEGAPFGEYRMNASEMRFHLPLLHEGDLLGFLAELQNRAPALVQVKQCQITRPAAGTERQAGDPNLDAKCRVQWTTIDKRLNSAGGQS